MKLRNKYWKYLLIVVQALLLTYLCYVGSNIPYALDSSKQSLKWFDTFASWMLDRKYDTPAEVLAINVSYDKTLVEANDEYGLPLGVIDITDRAKLHQLLQLIDSVGGYKYVICDVFLSSDYVTGADSALFRQIHDMPRIAITASVDSESLPELIRDKAYYSGYKTTIDESDFVKYPLSVDGRPSLPLHAWTAATGHKLHGNNFLCRDDEGNLARHSLFLDFPTRISEEHSDGESKSWLNMGVDLLDVADMLDIEELFRDKIILIGSFTDDDIHTTMAGEMPGIMIIYNAYEALSHGRHKVNYYALAILFAIFYIVSYMMINRKTLSDILPPRLRPQKHIIRLLISGLSLSSLFTVLFFILYIAFGEVYDIFLIAGYFTLFDIIIDVYYGRKKDI